MKPSVQKIVTKLAKEQEKKVEKVELGLVEDYNKRIDKANNERKSASVHYSNLIAKMQNAATQLELALKDAEKIESAAKDIGVKSPVDIARVKAKLSQYRKVVNALDSLTIRGGDDI